MSSSPSMVRRNLIATSLFLLLAFTTFGGMIFGPWLDSRQDFDEMRMFLSGCPPTELRYVGEWSWMNPPGTPGSYSHHLNLTFNFSRRELILISVAGTTGRKFGLFWQKELQDGFNSITAPLILSPVHYSDEEIARIKAQLNSLPAPQSLDAPVDPYHQYSFAFWKDGQKTIYRYPDHEATRESAELLRLLHLPSFR